MRTRRPGRGRPAHHAAGKRGGKQLDIIGRHQRAGQQRLRSSPVRRAPRRALRRRRRRKRSPRRLPATGAASTSRWRAAMSLSGSDLSPMVSSGASASASAGNKIGGGGKLGVGELDARIGRMQIDLLVCANFQLRRSVARARPRGAGTRTRPAQDRALERGDRVLPVAHAEPQQRMLEQSEQRHRRKAAERGFGGKPGKNSGRRVGERIAAGILRRDVPAAERGEHATPERAVGRNQRRGLSLLHRFAQRHRDGERLFLGIGRFDQRECRQRGVARAPRTPDRRRFAATCRSPPPAAAPPRPAARARTAPPRIRPRRARCRCARAAPAWRIADVPAPPQCLALVARDQAPGFFVEIGIEARQHHGAMRQARDGRDQFGGRRDRAGRAGGDHRRVGLARKPRGLRLDQRVAPLRRLDTIRARSGPPASLARDLQEFQRQLPIRIEHVGHEIVEPVPRHAAHRHVVDQPGEIVGERAGRRRRLRDERDCRWRRGARARRPIS